MATTVFQHPLAALDETRMRAFDLVLADYNMPGMDGLAVIRQLRGIEHYAQVPTCGVAALETFAAGLAQDGAAVRAALTTSWSNAQA